MTMQMVLDGLCNNYSLNVEERKFIPTSYEKLETMVIMQMV